MERKAGTLGVGDRKAGCLSKYSQTKGVQSHSKLSEALHTGFSGFDGGCNCVIVLLVRIACSLPLTSPEALYSSCTLCPAKVAVPVHVRPHMEVGPSGSVRKKGVLARARTPERCG